MNRVVMVHGFTQTGASWGEVAGRLRAAGHEVLSPDMPGHGELADADPDLWAAAAELGRRCGPATYVGYSMGGRYALHLALTHPAVVESLVLVGAHPGIDDGTERAERRAADERLAEEIERDGVDAFLERWMANPLFATLPRDAAGLEARRGNTAGGLAASLRGAGTGVQTPLWNRLPELRMPVLLVTGSRDHKFTAVAERMAALIPPPVDHLVVEGHGHAVHLEAPATFAGVLIDFLGSRDRESDRQ